MRVNISGQEIVIPMPGYLVLGGPTAVGKTAISEQLAGQHDIEIISADSRQVYRGMHIGTATPNADFLAKIPHHFINELNPDVVWSAGKFYKAARLRIRDILNRGKLPVVVGGTGLYLDALQNGLFDEPPRKASVRRHFEKQLVEIGAETLWQQLHEMDPDYASRFHFNDEKKLARAFEILELTGLPPTKAFAKLRDPFDIPRVRVILSRPREILYGRINQRVIQMIEDGLLEECENLLKAGFSPTLYPLKTIGYKETFAYLSGTIDETEMVHRIQQFTRNFAKRQLTWFRNHAYDYWIDID